MGGEREEKGNETATRRQNGFNVFMSKADGEGASMPEARTLTRPKWGRRTCTWA